MAEIIQHETQEAQALKAKYSPFKAKAHAPQPLREVGYNKRLEADMWGKATDLVDKSAHLVKAYTLAKDTMVANKTMQLMQSDHTNTMLGLTENLHQTDIENLDLQDTVAKWDNRDNEPFIIGKSDSKGKPTARINTQKLEDYNIPHSQKDVLEKYYNNLNKQKTDYLVKALPEILIGKAKFQLNTKAQELKNQVEGITLRQENYQTEMPPGVFQLLDSDPSVDLTDEEVKEMGEPAMAPSKYTLNLTPEANRELLELFRDYDKELIDVMKYGVISAEEGIVHQRTFTQSVIKTMFDADASRDEDGAYLKLQNGGYHIERDLLWGTDYSQKLKQIIHIDEKNSGPWVDAFRSKKQTERIKAEKKAVTNAEKSSQEDFTRVVQDPESYKSLTYKDVVNGYVTAGADEYQAKIYANAWELSKLAFDGKTIDNNVTFQLHALTSEIIHNGDSFEKKFATEQDDGQIFSIKGPKLQKALVTLAEDRLRQKKFNAMSTKDQAHTQLERITLTREEREDIAKASKKINSGHIQKMLTTRSANKRDNIKNYVKTNISRNAGSDIGKADLKERYMVFDEERGIYGPDHSKIDAIWERDGFDSNVEMGIFLSEIAKGINADDAAAAKKLNSSGGVNSEFMPDKMFKSSMQSDSQVFVEMLSNIANGSINQTAAFSEDPSKSYFEVNAVAYLNTKKGQNDKNFQARYKEKRVEGLLSPFQQNERNRMVQGFSQLYVMEEALMPGKNTTIEVLKGYHEELKHDKSKRGLRGNSYTMRAAQNIQARLQLAIIKLEPHNIKGTVFNNCWKDGTLDDACILKAENDHRMKLADINGSVSTTKPAFDLLNIIVGIDDVPEKSEETGEGVGR